jgi:hypothetical protein
MLTKQFTFFFFFLVRLGFELRAWKRSLCHLSCTSRPLHSGCLGNRVSLFPQGVLNCDPPILHFPPPLGWQIHATTPSFFSVELRFSQTNFCPGLAWNYLISASWVTRTTGVSHWGTACISLFLFFPSCMLLHPISVYGTSLYFFWEDWPGHLAIFNWIVSDCFGGFLSYIFWMLTLCQMKTWQAFSPVL